MMRLRRVVGPVDFRKSEHTNYLEWAKERENRDLAGQLGQHDVIAFVSSGKSQIVFIRGFDQLKNDEGAVRQVLYSQRLRITDGRWDPYMIVNYARMVGINLTGLRSFEEHFGYLISGKPIGGHATLRAVG
jgi:hypothetical protein